MYIVWSVTTDVLVKRADESSLIPTFTIAKNANSYKLYIRAELCGFYCDCVVSNLMAYRNPDGAINSAKISLTQQLHHHLVNIGGLDAIH